MRNAWMRCLVILLAFVPAPPAYSQTTLQDLLGSRKDIVVTTGEKTGFKAYYEIAFLQPLDHADTSAGYFSQRVRIGFNNVAAPTLMETQGYALGNFNAPGFMAGCNMVEIEHRYFGQSKPVVLNRRYLTVAQAAHDCHRVHALLAKIFTGKWLITGASKGGQAALAYTMYYPGEADITLVYGTPVKNGLYDARFNTGLSQKRLTPCGQKVFAFRDTAFAHKKELVHAFEKYAIAQKLGFDMPAATAMDYLLLEYPFAFFQGGGDCTGIPGANRFDVDAYMHALQRVVPPVFFSVNRKKTLEPAYYMFYHELGYYAYDLTGVQQWLERDDYTKTIYNPLDGPVDFDSTYQLSLNRFLASPGNEQLVFLYGENDPYALAQPAGNVLQNVLVLTVQNGHHGSRVKDLKIAQQQQLFGLLSEKLQWPVGYE